MKKIFSLILSLIFVVLHPIKVNAGDPILKYPDLVYELIKLENDVSKHFGNTEYPVDYHKASSESPFEFDEYRDIYLINIPSLLKDRGGFVRGYISAIEAALESLPLLEQAYKCIGKEEAEKHLDKVLDFLYRECKNDNRFDILTNFFYEHNSSSNNEEKEKKREKIHKSVIKAVIINICRILNSDTILKGVSGALLATVGSIIAILKASGSSPIIAAIALGASILGGDMFLDAKAGLEEKLSIERALNYNNLLHDFIYELMNNRERIMNCNYLVMAVDARKFTSWNPLNANRENQGHWLNFVNLKLVNSKVSPIAGYCTTNGGMNKLIKKFEDTLNGKTVNLELIKKKAENCTIGWVPQPKKGCEIF